MESKLKVDEGVMPLRRLVPRAVRAHVFVTAIVVSVLLGAGLRLIPTDAAAAAGSNAAGQGVASTACAAP